MNSSLRSIALLGRRSLLQSHSRFMASFLDQSQVTERVIETLKKFEKIDHKKITPNAHFIKDLGLDSLDTVEVKICLFIYVFGCLDIWSLKTLAMV